MAILIIGVLFIITALITFKTDGVNDASFFILMVGIMVAFVGFIVGCLTSVYEVTEMKELGNGWYQATIKCSSSSSKVLLSPDEAKFYIENPTGKISMYDFSNSYSERISKTHYYKGGDIDEGEAESKGEIETRATREN